MYEKMKHVFDWIPKTYNIIMIMMQILDQSDPRDTRDISVAEARRIQ